jgi:hypothetical protein
MFNEYRCADQCRDEADAVDGAVGDLFAARLFAFG